MSEEVSSVTLIEFIGFLRYDGLTINVDQATLVFLALMLTLETSTGYTKFCDSFFFTDYRI